MRLVEGDFTKKTTYLRSPFATAEQFSLTGARALHIVDLDGAREGRIVNAFSIAKIRLLNDIEIQVGGGIRTETAVEFLLGMGIDRVVVGSVALRSPELFASWVKKLGVNRFCVALDLKDGLIAHSGWQQTDASDFAAIVHRLIDLGIVRILTTDIRRDGRMEGPNIDLYKELVEKFPTVEWIASGGVRSKEDVAALRTTRVAGVVIGKALHEGRLRLEDVLEESC
ncbi:MAG: 1-(5-phosphoribosyl)-5-[(5-phosphoribosylamino)methylideneamino] imidazole-4-carboxamide isomerase [Ignavibacteriae bacterium]|nr:1-(5-phosphoribosyl)-5-[(5-phosphoribosylamino)methylideneamino] imidazole-4-carboxamide isomerase [Ignavibacteria bacterium]MBI3365645.1 1-(5-phosphoribosyl)-5-[(5-phosphoribosylamino)methylideneamino] imidazole-4-carboxamide isomerase [Ignavibacteriota bacterium]